MLEREGRLCVLEEVSIQTRNLTCTILRRLKPVEFPPALICSLADSSYLAAEDLFPRIYGSYVSLWHAKGS